MSEEVTLDDFGEQGENDDVSDEHPRFGSLPDDWEINEISNIAEIVGGSTPSTSNEDYWGGGIPWATPTDITGLSGNTISETEDTITEEGLDSASTHLLPPKSVLMTSRATIGKCAINTVEMATNQGFKSLVPADQIEPWYLYYRMLDTAAFLNSLGSGSTFDEISKTEVQSVDIPIPPLSEQRKIATVLYTVDRAIEKTEEVIEQTERVRAGTAQDLFSSGISKGKTKETWLGEIPEDWEVVQFSEIVESNRNGLYKAKDAYGEGCPIAKMGNALEKRTLDMSSADRLELTEEEKEKYGLEEGDLIFARRAQEVSAAGDCCFVPNLDELTVFESSLIRVRLAEEANPHFYTQYFDSPVGSRSIERIVTETSISGIATSDLLDLKVAVPSPDEQSEIASIMWQFDKQEKALKKERKRYERLKRGLMQDLLSGTVRTTDTTIEMPEEIAQHG